jgi:phytoene dehydrogenase-like protein
VRIRTSHRVVAIEGTGRVEAIRLAGGATVPVAAAIIASSPAVAADLVAGSAGTLLRSWAAAAEPVEAACLDVALSCLPVPRALFALGIDCPLYLSVHSAAARLAPPGGALVQVAKYVGRGPSDAKEDERELEWLLDLIQPGWRAAVVERSFLPRMTVTCDRVKASAGGLDGRPGPAVPGMANLFVAGDWVGPEGMLADAALASGARAAELVLAGEPRMGVAA